MRTEEEYRVVLSESCNCINCYYGVVDVMHTKLSVKIADDSNYKEIISESFPKGLFFY